MATWDCSPLRATRADIERLIGTGAALLRDATIESQQRRLDEMLRMMDEMTPRPAVVVVSYPFEQGIDVDVMRDELAMWCARYATLPIARL